jgi:nicotinate-nucleotide--dimethylbenzimidazole phosphoribosyltransferase
MGAAFRLLPIPSADPTVAQAARAYQLELTKPARSLGRLEDLAVAYSASRGTLPSARPARRALALFAGDHGVAAEGVSAYPSSVTAAMMANVMAGGAAVSVLARRTGVEIIAVDVGVADALEAVPSSPVVPLRRAKIRTGTDNFRHRPAMSRAEAEAALAVGATIADELHAGGCELAGVGEIGIANTTSAAALVCVFAEARPEDVCGRGTGIDDAGLARKIAVVGDALGRHAPRRDDPLGALAAVGGLELAAMTGFLLRAAAHRLPVVLDGFLANAAALAACAFAPTVVDHLIASHLSAERGARIALERLGLPPLLSLDLRLGEGTGALLAMELVDAAVALQCEMATFASAGVAKKLD